MKTWMMAATAVLLIAAAPVKLAPADDKPAQPVGAAARAKNGPDPMAKPPADVGSAEDPAPGEASPPLPPMKDAKTPVPPRRL